MRERRERGREGRGKKEREGGRERYREKECKREEGEGEREREEGGEITYYKECLHFSYFHKYYINVVGIMHTCKCKTTCK